MQLAEFKAELEQVEEIGPIEARVSADVASAEFDDVVHDSRQANSSTLFCAVPGLTVDGHDFIEGAVSLGASTVLVERFVSTAAAQLKVGSVRQAMAHAAAIVHSRPSADVAVVGITGTNGKTTTTQLLASILGASGKTCAVIGTLDGLHTTPESTALQRELRAAAAAGMDVVALEVSSHALDQHRVDATRFAVAAFSNLTPDHLDYHHDMESYFEAKARLFDGRAAHEVINVDDPWGARLAESRPDAINVSLRDLTIETETIAGSSFVWRGLQASVALPGQMNLANALMAMECARLLGMADEQIVAGLAAADPVAGRMQIVDTVTPNQPAVVVDYSHTPDSIERALATLRAVGPGGAVSIVFGCGGDRDRLKRPMMGQAAERGADRVYLTSDNPRSEDPMDIINDALGGFETPDLVIVDPDRKNAIARAIIDAGPADVILIAGKGHEKTQTIGSDVLPFDDVRVAQDILKGDEA